VALPRLRLNPLADKVVALQSLLGVGMNTWATDRQNINFLVAKCGNSQTAMAKMLNQRLSQPMISSLSRTGTGRHLHWHEARRIEQELKIPFGWMSRYSMAEVWPLVVRFRELSGDGQELFNDMLKLIDKKLAA
jgi:hypothetical protein